MNRPTFSLLLIACALISESCLAQSGPASPSAKATFTANKPAVAGNLALLTTAKTALNAEAFGFPLKCDQDDNLYLKNSVDGVPGIHKLNPAGKQLVVVQPKTATPEVNIAIAHYFSIARSGDVYQYVNSWDKPHHLVYVYKSDGSFKSYVKLQESFPWTPAQVAAFPSGNLLVTGLEYDQDRKAAKWPFTGIFSSDGTLLKEVKLEDDDAIHDMAAVGDSRVVSPGVPGVNSAIGLGQVDLANDGNIYVMRRLSPAIVYAISPEGGVVRRFTVDAGQPDYVPDSMHIAGNRIAVQFVHPQSEDQLIKVVDLEGRELTTYHVDRALPSPLGYAIACYTSSPDRFTFLGESDDGRLTLNVAGPK